MKRPTEAYRSTSLFELGLGAVVVCRFKSNGGVEAGYFLLDLLCLGVTDAGFDRFESDGQLREELLDELFGDTGIDTMTPAAARKLVEGSLAYARNLGFAPCADYKKAARVFGGISSGDCSEHFTFGKEGKPLYQASPSDEPAKRDRILRQLEARCGAGNFYFINSGHEEDIEGETGSSEGLEAMASRLQASRPGLETRFNAPGEKLSDILKTIVAPWLAGKDFDEVELLCEVTVLAWNTSRIASDSSEVLAEVRCHCKAPAFWAYFDVLFERARAMYPHETRWILELQTVQQARGAVLHTASMELPQDRTSLRKSLLKSIQSMASDWPSG